MTVTSPAAFAADYARAMPGSVLQLGPGTYPRITLDKPLNLMAQVAFDLPVAQGLSIRGRLRGFSVRDLILDGAGFESTDGSEEANCTNLLVRNTPGTAYAFEKPDSGPRPIHGITMTNCRASGCRIGVIAGRAWGVKLKGMWIDRFGDGTSATHAYYLNDDAMDGDLENCWATRGTGTAFRGTGTRASKLFAYQCRWGIASGKNCSYLNRPIAIDIDHLGGVEINTWVAHWCRDALVARRSPPPANENIDAAGIAVSGGVLSPYLQVTGARVYGYGPGRSFVLNAAPVDQYGRGRGDVIEAVVSAGGAAAVSYSVPNPAWWHWSGNSEPVVNPDTLRTPEMYLQGEYGPGASLDSLWAMDANTIASQMGLCHDWMWQP